MTGSPSQNSDRSRAAKLLHVHLDGSHWEYATTSPPDQRREHYDALDGRAAWLYEAVTNDLSMHGQKTGKGLSSTRPGSCTNIWSNKGVLRENSI